MKIKLPASMAQSGDGYQTLNATLIQADVAGPHEYVANAGVPEGLARRQIEIHAWKRIISWFIKMLIAFITVSGSADAAHILEQLQTIAGLGPGPYFRETADFRHSNDHD